jgi:hypothetical protein
VSRIVPEEQVAAVLDDLEPGVWYECGQELCIRYGHERVIVACASAFTTWGDGR